MPADANDVEASLRLIQTGYDWDGSLPARARTRRWKLEQAVKRLMDVFISAALLFFLSPLLLLLAIVVRITSHGPALFEWRVLGERARPFVGYKFRTMIHDAEHLKHNYLDRNEMAGPVFKMRNDPRVTPLGRFLRKYSIDELPQLWSVLKGDMTLVGPRPPFPVEFLAFKPWQQAKLAVRPGLTCYWQVNGRSTINGFDEWARLDLLYINEWNLWVDLKILVRTIPAVLRGHGAY